MCIYLEIFELSKSDFEEILVSFKGGAGRGGGGESALLLSRQVRLGIVVVTG